MAILLNPDPTDLGIVAPVLGPWFTQSVILPAPATSGKLALDLTFPMTPSATDWLPPAAGTLTLFVADPSAPPAAIAHLQDADGDWPFAAGTLVAYYRLLPEVEERVQDLMRLVPPVTGGTLPALPTTPFATNSRPRVRSFALVLSIAVTPGAVRALFVDPLPGSGDAEQMTAVGLAIRGGSVVNGIFPMTWLRRPGNFLPPSGPAQQDRVLANLPPGGQLWAFDHRGRAIDPGAVAAWWSWLVHDAVGDGGAGFQMLPPGIDLVDLPPQGGRFVLCPFDAARTVHLVDAHEGRLGSPLLGGRLRAGTTTPSARLLSVTASQTFSFSPPPTTPTPPPPPDDPVVDDAPLPRVAVLPEGPYAPTATVWPGGAALSEGLERDFVRVAAVEEERHLLGVRRRGSRETPANPAERRASAQNRPSTRTSVSRTAGGGPVLLATAEDAAAALLDVIGAPVPARAVLGVADLAWGPTPEGLLAVVGAPPFPAVLAEDAALGPGTYRVRALAGGGVASGRQAVLAEFQLEPGLAGAWIRAWPLGFDLKTGVHFRLSGGGGRVDPAGRARVVLTLIPGRVDPVGLMAMDVAVSHRAPGDRIARRLYADRRFERPAALPGTPVDAASFGGATAWAVCETGATGTGALPVAVVPPGASVVLTSGADPAIVDVATIPAAARASGTLVNTLTAGDIVSLTEPAFLSTPDKADALGRPVAREGTEGSPTGRLETVAGVVVHRLERGGTVVSASSAPFALQDRLETAAAAVDGGAGLALAAIGAAPPLPFVHDTLPHELGGPGSPAAIEIHGTGAVLDGPPAVALAEYVRERTSGLGFGPIVAANEPARSVAVQSELAVGAEAVTALPALPPGAGPGPVVAVLRTTAAGQEGIAGVAAAAEAGGVFPLSRHEQEVEDWLNGTTLPGGGGLGTALRGAIGTVSNSVLRALDRRLQVGAFGAREAAVAITAAIERAQDFVYIETPAVDALAHGDESLNPWTALISRMSARRGLHVVLCVPALLAPGTPRMLQQVRDAALIEAIDRIRTAAVDRVAVFSPGAGAGRPLRIASTTVVVDDAFAVTGTSHLWRRGMTYDSSIAVAAFDERLIDGRPFEVRAFRQQLMADRLGLRGATLPDDPAELTNAVRVFDQRGSQRLSARLIRRPDPVPTTTDIDIWNPDGTRTDLTLPAVVALFAAAVALTDSEHAITEG